MAWAEYETYLLKNWGEILDTEAHNEKKIQRFLECHPCILPGSFGLSVESGHYPFPSAVISQPPLHGLEDKIPDFMWIACDSGTIYPILIEIEAPAKRWFTKKGVPTAQFTQAQNQLAEWKVWFSNPIHQSLFIDYFHISSSFLKGKDFKPLYALIYGRRQEFANDEGANRKRTMLARESEYLMTYDRLRPKYDASNLMCVRVTQQGFSALTIPPTLKLGPMYPDDTMYISDKEQAARGNNLISPARKEFLIERFAYWDIWNQRRQRSKNLILISSADRE